MSIALHHGDCIEVMAGMAEASVDACVCDPPYHLQSIHKRFAKVGRDDKTWSSSGPHQRTARGFMNQQWDGGDIAFRVETWAEVLRVLKPGGHLIAFSGTRTYHRMVCAIEDAGFEIRDQIGWLYGSGFPKSHNLPGGLGTALKPAWEPICLARKPLSESTIAANVAAHGTGALNIDGCRVALGDEYDPNKVQRQRSNRQTWEGGKSSGFAADHEQATYDPAGRWPANLAHDSSDEVLEAFAGQAAERGLGRADHVRSGRDFKGWKSIGNLGVREAPAWAGEIGGNPARFFYSAKATKAERGEGNSHPTVKPIALCRWLCRLVTPPGGTVLDPFAGSGSTLIAADREGFNAIGIEREQEYCEIARRRLAEDAPLLAGVA